MPNFTAIKLDEEEISDPCLVLTRFFDYADIHSVRKYLWDWFKITVTGTYNTNALDELQRSDMINFFEHIEKLIEAAHLINLKNPKRNAKKKNR